VRVVLPSKGTTISTKGEGKQTSRISFAKVQQSTWFSLSPELRWISHKKKLARNFKKSRAEKSGGRGTGGAGKRYWYAEPTLKTERCCFEGAPVKKVKVN